MATITYFPAAASGSGAVSTVASGVNISVNASDPANPVVSTVLTGFVQRVYATSITAPDRVFEKAGGTGTTAVTNTYYVGTDSYKAYSGAAGFVTGARIYAQVTPGATVASSSVPMDLCFDVNAAGVATDPKTSNVGGFGYCIPFRIVAGVGTAGVVGGDHYGTACFNAPASMTEADLVCTSEAGGPSGVHETSSINTFGLYGSLYHSFSRLHWRPNAAAVFRDVGGDGWAYTDNTAGNEATYYECTGLYQNKSEILFRVDAVTGKVGTNSHGLMKPSFGYSFFAPETPLITYVQGAGTYYDLYIARRTGTPGTIAYGFAQEADGGNIFRVAEGSPAGSARVWVGTAANQNSWCYDEAVGGLYSRNDYGSTQIGRPGVLAVGSTKEFLCLSTMAGAPTGQPLYLSSGKTPIAWNSTHLTMHANRPGSTTWDVIPTVAAAANGTVATTVTSLGPAGSSTTIVRWAKFPDGAGGFFLCPSYL